MDELVDALCVLDSETTTTMKLSDEEARQAHWIVELCERTYTPSKEILADFAILDKFAYKDDDISTIGPCGGQGSRERSLKSVL